MGEEAREALVFLAMGEEAPRGGEFAKKWSSWVGRPAFSGDFGGAAFAWNAAHVDECEPLRGELGIEGDLAGEFKGDPEGDGNDPGEHDDVMPMEEDEGTDADPPFEPMTFWGCEGEDIDWA